MTPDVITIDFETHPIRQRPDYPPRAVGVSIKWPRQPSRYYAFGHPTGNNCSEADALEALQRCYDSGLPLLFHNAKYDYEVLLAAGFPELPWDRLHDTLFLAYLFDPHARELGLKELAADLLQWPPEERDAVADWVMAHKATLLQTYPHLRKLNKQGMPIDNIAPSDVGGWIFAAPGDLVGRYACGDTDRTAGLWEYLWPIIQEHGMGAAYDRERELMPILLENEQIGMRVDMEELGADVDRFDSCMGSAEQWLRTELRDDGLNFDADVDVGNALFNLGIVPAENWQLTRPTKTHPNGQRSMAKDNLLPDMFTGPNGDMIAAALGYRNRLKTCLSMFMQPWLDQASCNRGYITTNWNQTRGGEGGTRTGRPSTNRHNFLNLSKKWDGKDDGYRHPDFLAVSELPLVRNYVLPDEGDVFLHRDFDGQEMRVFAHGEQGDLNRQFNDNPALDPHEFIGTELQRVAGREIERTKVKTLNFQSLYGGGVPALQKKLRIPHAEAKELKVFHDRALPGRTILNEEIKRVTSRGLPIRTWGGRLYFPEEPGFSKAYGRHMTWDYKLINYWTQGSAADLTKESIIQWRRAKGRGARFMVTVYDEINLSASPDTAVADMALLKNVMEQDRLSVPMRSSPKHGPSWGKAKKCPPEKGCPLCR